MKNQRFYTVDEAITLLENYCAYQERCHKDVETKLFQLHLIPEAKEKIILHLIQHNYLNEERFAKAFARGKFSIKNWGKQRIKKELKLRNISNYNINSALKEINEEEYLQTLETLSTKKLQLIKETDLLKKKSKLANYLISKGFETTLVFNHLNTIFT